MAMDFHKIFACIRGIGTMIGGALTFLYGGMDQLLITLICFICIDYVTGVLCGISKHELSSDIGFKGIARKVIILMLVAIGHLGDKALGLSGTLRDMVIIFYLANEGLSIVENACTLGLPVPKKLKAVLQQLKEKAEEDDEENQPKLLEHYNTYDKEES